MFGDGSIVQKIIHAQMSIIYVLAYVHIDVPQYQGSRTL